jgi:hypothetical protein
VKLSLTGNLGLKLFKVGLHECVAERAQGAPAVCIQACLDVNQLEQMLVKGAVGLACLKLAGFKKALRDRRIEGHPGLNGISDCPGHSDGANRVQLIGVKKDFGFQSLGWFMIVPETMSPDAMQNGRGALVRPAFSLENPASEFSGSQMVAGAVGRFFLGIMQKSSCLDDLKVSPLNFSQMLGKLDDA